MRHKKIFSILICMIFMTGFSAANATDSTGISPITPNPGETTILASGTTPLIIGQGFQYPTTKLRCPPAVANPQLQLNANTSDPDTSLSGEIYAIVVYGSLDPRSYNIQFADVRAIRYKPVGFSSGYYNSRITVNWTIYCVPKA